MAAITVSYTTILDARIDVDSPITQELMFDFRDNIEFVKQWMGQSFLATAVQDHDHDGFNSKLIAVSNRGATLARFTALAGGPTHNAPLNFTPNIVFRDERLYTSEGSTMVLARPSLGFGLSNPLIAEFIFGGFRRTSNASTQIDLIVMQDLANIVKVFEYTSDGDPLEQAITGIGFQPDFVIVGRTSSEFTTGTRGSAIFTSNHAAPNSRSLYAAGGLNNVTNGIRAVSSDGFTVGTLINSVGAPASNKYNGFCLKETSGVEGGNAVKIVNYTGNDADDREIIGVGFRPDAIILVQTGSENSRSTLIWTRGVRNAFAGFQGDTADGFLLHAPGQNKRFNNSGEAYSAVCMKFAYVPQV